MRENSIRFEFVVLKASDIAIQTPFRAPGNGPSVREADTGSPRVTRGAGPSRDRIVTGSGASLT